MAEKKRRTAKEVILSLREQVKQGKMDLKTIREQNIVEARSRFDLISIIVENFEQVFESNEQMRNEVAEMQKIYFQDLDEYSYQICERIKEFSKGETSSNVAPVAHGVNPMGASMNEMKMRQKEMTIERQKKEIRVLNEALKSSQGVGASDQEVNELHDSLQMKEERIKKMNAEINHYLKEMQELQKKLRKSESTLRRMQNKSEADEQDSGKMHQLQQDILTKSEALESLQTRFSELSTEHEKSKASEGKLAEILPLYEKLQIEQNSAQEQLAGKDNLIKELQEQVAKITNELSEKEVEDPRISSLENEVQSLREQLVAESQKVDPKVIALESQVSSLKNEIKVLTEEAEQEDPQIKLLQSQLEELSARAQESEKDVPQIEAMQSKIENLQQEMSTSSKLNEELKSQVEKLVNEREEVLRPEITQLSESVNSLQVSLGKKEEDNKILQGDLEAITGSMKSKDEELGQLKLELDEAKLAAASAPPSSPSQEPAPSSGKKKDIDFSGLVSSLESIRNDHMKIQEEVAAHHKSFMGDYDKTVQFVVNELSTQRQKQVDQMVIVITQCIDRFTILYESKELLKRDMRKLQKENNEMIAAVSEQLCEQIAKTPMGGDGGGGNNIVIEPLFEIVDHVGELKNDLKDLRISVKKLITDFGTSSSDLTFNLSQVVGQMIQMKDLEIRNLKKQIEGDGKKMKQSSGYFYYQKGKKRGKKWDRVWLHFYKDKSVYIFKRESDRNPFSSIDCKANLEIQVDEEMKDDFCIRIETVEKKGVFHRILCSNKDDLEKWMDYIEKWRKK